MTACVSVSSNSRPRNSEPLSVITAETRQPVLEAYLKGNEPPDEAGAVATAPGQPLPPQQAPDAAQAADQMLKGGL